MDKTYNDLLDIVNRTKKMNGGSTTRTKPIRQTRTEPIDEAKETVRVVKPAKDLDKSKPSLFAGSDAISKYLNKNKKSTKKETEEKSKKTKKTETKKTTKKTENKKTETKKTTKPKVEEKKEIEKKEIKLEAPKVEEKKDVKVDMTDPKNVKLYNALKDTLFSGGTDISDYVEDSSLSEAASNLKALKEKKSAERINEEISKEQQEYEQLFNGSFFGNSEEKNTEESYDKEQVEENIDNYQNIETEDSDNNKVTEDSDNNKETEEVVEDKPTESNIEETPNHRSEKDIAEIKVRDMEVDRKIAEYYKQKQEKIERFNAEEQEEPIQENNKVNDYEERQRAYDDIFSGEVVSRDELLGIKEDSEEEINEDSDNVEESSLDETIEENLENNDNHIEEINEENSDSQTELEENLETIDDTESDNESEYNISTEDDVEVETIDNEINTIDNEVETINEPENVSQESNDNVSEFQSIYKSFQADNEDKSDSIVVPNSEIIPSENTEIQNNVREDIIDQVMSNDTNNSEENIVNTENNLVQPTEENLSQENMDSKDDTEENINTEEGQSSDDIEDDSFNFLDDDDKHIYEQNIDELVEKHQNIQDVYDLSEEDAGLEDYIVSSSVPIEEDKPLEEYNHEDNSLVIDSSILPESQIDVFGKSFEKENNTEDVEENDEDNSSEDDSISKEEFYNEMARLQQNLISELKGQKITEPSVDFFEEKKEVEEKDESSTINKALDIINNLTSQPSTEDNKETENKNIEDKETEKVPEPENIETKEENAESPIENTESRVQIPSEIMEDSKVEESGLNLLNKDIALNEKDLEFFDNSIKPKDIDKDNCFYMSEEDKTKKSELQDEYLTAYNEEVGQEKEVGDINLNKDINNAVSYTKEINEKNEVNKSEDDEIQTIYTLFGMERKKMEKEQQDIKVLYVASECQPFIATGGLADVAGSLPKAIAELGGVDIRVILPLYGNIKSEYRDKFEYLGNFTVHLSWRQEYCGLFKYFKDGVTYYFIDNERYFKREKTYGYYDDGERFAYFCKAIVESLPMINFFPDIIHCNDWQSSLVSTYIKTGNWSDFRYYKIKNIYTIHNVEYQGVYGMDNLKDLFGIESRFRNDMEYNGDINLTKAAIQYSDKFTTVSESYCDNLKQPYCSRGLHHIIIRNEYKLSGIINGLDYEFYNPETDKIIYKNYNADTLEDKVMNKKIWQEELGLPVDGKTPMLAVVSRLVSHKGLDLLDRVLEEVLAQDIQLVVVGTGDQRFVDYYKYLEGKYPTKVRALVDAFSVDNARKAYAASDIFIMPSKVEPCGISQMIASRYGSIPIVREVGGLKDSIKDFGCEEGGNGYTFTNYNPNDLKYQINRAIKDYHDETNWKKKMRIAMTTDFHWTKSAEKYIDLYKSLV